MSVTIHNGDCLEFLKGMPDESVQCCVTSPPYWGLRDYGVEGQIGLESTVEGFIDRLVAVFREVRRVLKSDGVCWVNMGDSYASTSSGSPQTGLKALSDRYSPRKSKRSFHRQSDAGIQVARSRISPGLKPKDLVGQPWMLAFALRADGWYLRQDIIWHKPNPMPESVLDRCTKSHEYLFLLSKAERYFWDPAGMREPSSGTAHARISKRAEDLISARRGGGANTIESNHDLCGVGPKSAIEQFGVASNSSKTVAMVLPVEFRNRRSVWSVQSEPLKDAHFAAFPTALVRPCVLSSTRPGDVVLDPFGGSGTTGMVALELGRSAILCELNPDYAALIRRRVSSVTPGLAL